MKLWNAWARSYRNARGLAAAAVLLLATLSLLSLRCNPMTGREAVLGLVLDVEAEGLHPPGDVQVHARVLLAVPEPDSTEIRMMLPPPVPRVGDFIPLTIERYKKGNVTYSLDRERWLTEGPQ